MNHNVKNVLALHTSSKDLYDIIVVNGETSADAILYNLHQGIENLKQNWKGIDAGKKIQEVIVVHNEMVAVRNALATLAYDSSKVACNYREIQNANGAGLEYLTPLTTEDKVILPDYTDIADTIDINPSAEVGRNHIDAANTNLTTFIENVTILYNEILDNWQAGTGRDSAQTSFDNFVANAKKYQETLTDVSTQVHNALKNYSF